MDAGVRMTEEADVTGVVVGGRRVVVEAVSGVVVGILAVVRLVV